MKKLSISIFMFFGVIVLIGSQEARAITGGVISEEIKMTAAEKVKQIKVEAIIERIDKTYKNEPWTVKWSKIAVPHYKQINDWYCGPATTAQTIRYFKMNEKLTQTTLGKELGTTTNGTAYSSIKTVLNKKSFIKEKFGFYNVTNKSKQLIGGWLGYSVQVRRPVVLNIAILPKNTASKEALGYETPGHFLNSSGVYGEVSRLGIGNVTRIEVTDPFNYIGNKKNKKNNKTGKVNATIGVIKAVIDSQPAATKNILW